MPRELTSSEARVLAVLLATGDEPEKVRLERSGAPRSTYVTARRRAYDLGWVRDRFVPSPGAGFRSAHWMLARPFLEKRQELEERWSKAPGTVLLWRWPEHLFAVRLGRSPSPPGPTAAALVPTELGKLLFEMRSDLSRPQVPVYFDYEGAWANLVDVPPSRGYPRALGSGGLPASEPSEGLRRSVAALVERPFEPIPSEGRVFRRFTGAGGLPRSQRRLLAKGWASWRVFPDLRAIPGYEGRRVRRLVLTEGRLRDPEGLEGLFQDLWSLSRAAPFLLASDGSRALVGFLGLGEPAKSEVRPVGSRDRPVSRSLQDHLSDIQSFSVPVDDLELLVDHRYDRLFGRP